MEENNLASEVLKQLKDQHKEENERHQEECDRLHSIITRLIVALCIVSALLVGTICYQIYNSYLPTEDTTISQDSKDGQNNYIGKNGEINNGKTNDKNN
jgi:hypothetical protein